MKTLVVLIPALLLLAGCSSDDKGASPTDATPITGTPAATTPVAASPTPTPGGGGGDIGPGTVVPVSPTAPGTVVPSDWNTFEDSSIAHVVFSYPSAWSLDDGKVTSFSPETAMGPTFPAGGTAVGLNFAQQEFAEPRPDGASDSTLGDRAGWEIIYDYPKHPEGIERVHILTADLPDYRVYLIASYGVGATDDESIFQIIASSFEFRD